MAGGHTGVWCHIWAADTGLTLVHCHCNDPGAYTGTLRYTATVVVTWGDATCVRAAPELRPGTSVASVTRAGRCHVTGLTPGQDQVTITGCLLCQVTLIPALQQSTHTGATWHIREIQPCHSVILVLSIAKGTGYYQVQCHCTTRYQGHLCYNWS